MTDVRAKDTGEREDGGITLTEFLLARIAEDEAEAGAATPGPWFTECAHHGGGDDQIHLVPDVMRDKFGDNSVSTDDHATAAFIARHDPARVLAECEAKRRIVEALVDMEPVEAERRDQVVTLRWACQLHAETYADHPELPRRVAALGTTKRPLAEARGRSSCSEVSRAWRLRPGCRGAGRRCHGRGWPPSVRSP